MSIDERQEQPPRSTNTTIIPIDDNDVVWYANDGSESFTKSTIDDDLVNARQVVVRDMDDDGDLDVIATSSNSSGDDLVWYANDGSENFTANAIANDLASGAFDLQVQDIDGDNDQDVIVTAFNDNDVLWYANDGSENFTKNTIDNNFSGPAEVASGDLDGDGDLDVVATARTGNDVMFYANSDSGYVLGISLSGTPNGSETLTISPTSNSIYDFAGNAAATSQSYSTVTLNFVGPPRFSAISLASNNSTVAVTFNAAVYSTNGASGSLEASDFSFAISGGTATLASSTPSSISASSNTYTLGISLSGTPDGTEFLFVYPVDDGIYNAAGAEATTSQSFNTVLLNDVSGPTMVITGENGGGTSVADGASTSDNPLTMTFTASEPTSDFAVGDITVSGGSLSSFSASSTTITQLGSDIDGEARVDYSGISVSMDSDGDRVAIGAHGNDGTAVDAGHVRVHDVTHQEVYTATFTPSAEGATTIDVASSTFNDGAGNDNSAADQYNWTYDTTGPLITITATDGSNAVTSGSFTNDATLSITFTANESVTGFAVGDVGVVGGSLSSFSGSGATYTATFTPSSDRNTAIYIPASGFTDAATNNNLASIPFYWTYDGTAPTYISGTYITGNNSKVKIRLSETVYDTDGGSGALEVGDFTLSISGGTATLASTNPTAITKDVPTFSETKIDNNLDGAWGVKIVDLDFDGDKDVVAGGHFGDDLNWYENDGSESFTERSIDANLDGVLGLAVNDIDGDGDLDILATAKNDDDVVLYTNNGSQSFTKSVIDSDLGGAQNIGCSDLNDDGYMDVIATGAESNKVIWYRNDGSQNFTENTIDESIDGPLRFVVKDLDEDGDKDILICARDDDDVVWLSNNGSESFTKNTIDNNIELPRDVEVIDLDEDGDLDIVATSGNSAGDEVVWYSNDGSENFTRNSIESSLGSATTVDVKDLDGDNDLDLIVNSFHDDVVLWYANDGSENFTKNFVDNSLDQATAHQVDDVDGDGDLDVVSTGKAPDDVMFYTNSDSGYVLDISLSGTPDGSETLTISPTGTSIYDFVGNAAATSQSYSTVTLKDQTVPTITGNNLASDNSTIAVTFSEAVYNSNDGSGSLEVGDFALSISGGNATLSSATPSSISISSNTYTLGIPLSGTANGSETLTVSPVDDSIYDAAGNEASTSQSNNTASLNANYVNDLDGTNDQAYVANSSDFEPDNFTVQAWVNLDAFENEDYFVYRHKTWFIGFSRSDTKIEGGVRDDDGDW